MKHIIYMLILTVSLTSYAENNNCHDEAMSAAIGVMKINGEPRGEQLDSKLTINDRNYKWEFTYYEVFEDNRKNANTPTYEVEVSDWYFELCKVNSLKVKTPQI